MKNVLTSLLLALSYLLSFGQSTEQVADAQPRTPLFEVLTSSTCPPCNQGNKDLSEVLEKSDGNWTCVKYQMYFPGSGDPYFTEEGYTRARYYDLSGVPTLRLDGTNEMYPGALTNQMLKDHQAVASKVNLYSSFWQDGKDINVTINVEPNQNVLTPFLKLFVAIVENKTFNNVETNGETEFEWVMKKMIPDGNGQSLSPLKVGTTQTFEYTFEFNGNYRLPQNANDPINHEIEHSVEEFDDLSVVVWVQNRNTQEILQSTWATFLTNTEEEQSQSGNGIISVFPNPVKDATHLHYLVKKQGNFELSVYDLNGKLLYSRDLGEKTYGNYIESIDLSSLGKGAYLLNLKGNGEIFQQQLLKL